MLHDDGAKRIFGTPVFMRDFLRLYAPFDWAPEIRTQDIEFIDGEHIGDSRNASGRPEWRYSDLMCRVRNPRSADHPGALLVVLFEAQARPDPRMPVRMHEYVALALGRLWAPGERFPLLLPVVFYTGSAPWRVPVKLEELHPADSSEGHRFLPRMEYLVVGLGDSPSRDPKLGRLLDALLSCLRASPGTDVTRPLAELKVVAERDGEEEALERVVLALATALHRRHRPGPPRNRITRMEALMEETREWNVEPGLDEILAERDHLLAQERERLAQERKRGARERERLAQERERNVQLVDSMRALLLRVDATLSEEELARMSVDELQELVDRLR